MLNLSQNRLGDALGMASSLPSLIALNLGEYVPLVRHIKEAPSRLNGRLMLPCYALDFVPFPVYRYSLAWPSHQPSLAIFPYTISTCDSILT